MTNTTPIVAPSSPTMLARSITIGTDAERIYRCWLEPETLPQIMKDIAHVSVLSPERTKWLVELPLGQTLEWESTLVEERPYELLRWRSVEEAPIYNEGTLMFSPAPRDWGTEVRFTFHFNPPGGALGDVGAKLLGDAPALVLAKILRRFKSLVETGEIPTTDYQPAAREHGQGK
jgi:uncharacterized membrane protein